MAALIAVAANDILRGGRTVQEMLAEKCAEAASLEADLERLRLETLQLRVRLQASGVSDPSLLPACVKAGSGAVPGQLQHFELRSLLQWVVDGVDLTQQVVFECGNGEGEVMVGGRWVLLQRMATWKLHDGLKLSVPLEQQAEIAIMLASVRGRGVDETTTARLGEAWELVGAEVVSNAAGTPEPAIFLVHRETAQAIVIAQWPSVEFASSGARTFDPTQHFRQASQSSSAVPSAAVADVCSLSPRLAPSVSTGDRVEVEFEGQWFSGVLQWVDGDVANVKCDVDSPGVITVAPLGSVRPAPAPAASATSPESAGAQASDAARGNDEERRTAKMPPRHRRVRSVG